MVCSSEELPRVDGLCNRGRAAREKKNRDLLLMVLEAINHVAYMVGERMPGM